MAERFGFAAAWDETSYTAAGMSKLGEGIHPCVHEFRWLHAIPNGGLRDKITAGKLKAEGVKRGIPDVFLPVPLRSATAFHCGLYVEMKRPKSAGKAKGSTSEVQDEAIGYLRHIGYAVSVCFDWIAAAKELQSYVEAVRLANA